EAEHVPRRTAGCVGWTRRASIEQEGEAIGFTSHFFSIAVTPEVRRRFPRHALLHGPGHLSDKLPSPTGRALHSRCSSSPPRRPGSGVDPMSTTRAIRPAACWRGPRHLLTQAERAAQASLACLSLDAALCLMRQ